MVKDKNRNKSKSRNKNKNKYKNPVIQVGEDEFLLYNPTTKTADIVDNDVMDRLSDPGTLPEEVRDLLKRHGHITDKSESERERTAFEEYKAAYAQFSAHTQSYLIPTYSCNMRCTYCYEKDLRREHKVMDSKTLDSFLEAVHTNSSKDIILYGGEPLQKVTKPIVEQAVSQCEEMGYTLTVCTNGLELKEFSHILDTFSTIMITLDGIERVQNVRRPRPGKKDSFTAVIEAIEHVTERGIPLIVSVNADAHNMDELPALADFFISKGWDNKKNVEIVVSHIMQSLDRSYPYIAEPREAAKRMVALYRKFPQMEIFLPSIKGSNPLVNVFFEGEEWRPKYWYCGANCYMLFYDLYGYIYTCYMVIGRQEFAVGRFHETLEFFPTLKIWRERSCFSIPACRECSFRYVCGGGCGYRQYLRTGSFEDPYCDVVEGLAESYVPFLYERMKERGGRL